MARIVIASLIVRYPVGGYQSWMLQWLLGLERLGHEVYFVEKAGWENSCFNPLTGQMGNDPSYGVDSLQNLFKRFGLEGRWCYVSFDGTYYGLSSQQVENIFRTTDLYIDHMRVCEWEEESQHASLRVMVDGEPAFCQMQIEQRERNGEKFPMFDHYYSVGLNIGSLKTNAPDAGRHWRPVIESILPELFSRLPPPAGSPWTTVMSWQAHSRIEYNGIRYGQKDIEFEKFFDLPSRVKVPLELAIAGKSTPWERLLAAGWRLRDSHAVTLTYDAWLNYIQNSLGEFSVAKNVFVQTNSGWWSDRSSAYLASGRPVVVQDTGFSDHLPCGKGLFAVKTVEEAAAAIEEVVGNYKKHSEAAYGIALEHLDARKVLGTFLNEIGM